MIQRKQTLFLLFSGLINVVLLFFAAKTVMFNTAPIDIALIPLRIEGLSSTVGHMAAIYLNFAVLVLTSLSVFMYTKRQLQITISYVSAMLMLILAGMIAMCPFVTAVGESLLSEKPGYLACVLAVLGAITSVVAARYVKKDIDLLKSADRIR